MAQPLVRQCRFCQQTLAPYIPATRSYCGAIACRAAWQKELLAQRKVRQQQLENSLRTDIRQLALQQASGGGFDPDDMAVTRVPYNPHEIEQTAASDRNHLIQWLEKLLHTLERKEDTYQPEHELQLTPHLDKDLVAACSTCRGKCCLQGRNHHAFIQRSTLKRVMDKKGLSPDEVMAGYIRQLPAASMNHGCLYQTETGCNLEPDWRADICKDYYCDSLLSLMRNHSRTKPARNLIIATDKASIEAASLLREGEYSVIPIEPQIGF